MSEASKAVCKFCYGLHYESVEARQCTVYGKIVLLHPQCKFRYEQQIAVENVSR